MQIWRLSKIRPMVPAPKRVGAIGLFFLNAYLYADFRNMFQSVNGHFVKANKKASGLVNGHFVTTGKMVPVSSRDLFNHEVKMVSYNFSENFLQEGNNV